MHSGRNVCLCVYANIRLPRWLRGEEPACQVVDSGSIPVSGRSPGEKNGYPSSILAWRIPWMEEPGRL